MSLTGGAQAARHCLAADLVDELEINLVPTLLGRGEPVFDGLTELHGLEFVRAVAAPKVTHPKFERS